MRGKVRRCRFSSMRDRITPAYAGKRSELSSSSFASWDHPRLCGEKNSTTGNERRLVGSPPPMRGKGNHCIFGLCVEKDHPRLCGEKVVLFCTDFKHIRITPAYAGKSFCNDQIGSPIQGSPPPMRGKVHAIFAVLSPAGITPAYAGKRVFSSRSK